MKTPFLRMSFLLLCIFLQLSFFDILFPWFRAPLFLLGVVVVFTLVRGFPSALFMTVPLTLLYDVITLGSITWFSVYAVIFSYGTGFLSRRLLIEHRGFGLALYAFIAYSGILLYQTFFSFVVYKPATSDAMSALGLMPQTEHIIFSLIVSFPIFIVTYVLIQHFEEYLIHINQQRFQKIR